MKNFNPTQIIIKNDKFGSSGDNKANETDKISTKSKNIRNY